MKQIKATIGLALVVAAFYTAWMMIPPYYHQFQFQDAVSSEARLQSYTAKTEQEIRAIIMKKARENEIPIREEQVIVQRNGSEVNIDAKYTVNIDLPLYPLKLNFEATSRNKAM